MRTTFDHEPMISGKKLSEMAVGDVFYESQFRMSVKLTMATLPVSSFSESLQEKQWKWDATREDGSVVNYLITERHQHYGPHLSLYPAYINMPPEAFEGPAK